MTEIGLTLLSFTVGLVCYCGLRQLFGRSLITLVALALAMSASLILIGTLAPGFQSWISGRVSALSILSLPAFYASWGGGFAFGLSNWSDFITK